MRGKGTTRETRKRRPLWTTETSWKVEGGVVAAFVTWLEDCGGESDNDGNALDGSIVAATVAAHAVLSVWRLVDSRASVRVVSASVGCDGVGCVVCGMRWVCRKEGNGRCSAGRRQGG